VFPFRVHRALIFVDLRVFVLNADSNVKVDDLQAKVIVADNIVGLDVSMGYSVLVKVREPFDEAPAELDPTGVTSTVQEILVAYSVQLR